MLQETLSSVNAFHASYRCAGLRSRLGFLSEAPGRGGEASVRRNQMEVTDLHGQLPIPRTMAAPVPSDVPRASAQLPCSSRVQSQCPQLLPEQSPPVTPPDGEGQLPDAHTDGRPTLCMSSAGVQTTSPRDPQTGLYLLSLHLGAHRMATAKTSINCGHYCCGWETLSHSQVTVVRVCVRVLSATSTGEPVPTPSPPSSIWLLGSDASPLTSVRLIELRPDDLGGQVLIKHNAHARPSPLPRAGPCSHPGRSPQGPALPSPWHLGS